MDLNHRPLGYEPNELPDCSTPHSDHSNHYQWRQTAGRAGEAEGVLSSTRWAHLRLQIELGVDGNFPHPAESQFAFDSLPISFVGAEALVALSLTSVFQFVALARTYDLGRIDCFFVDLLFENLAVFSD